MCRRTTLQPEFEGSKGQQAGEGEEEVDAALFELHVQGEHAAVVEGDVGGGLADEAPGGGGSGAGARPPRQAGLSCRCGRRRGALGRAAMRIYSCRTTSLGAPPWSRSLVIGVVLR
jgi:hypothetical protein